MVKLPMVTMARKMGERNHKWGLSSRLKVLNHNVGLIDNYVEEQLPGDECEEGSNDEDIIKHSKSNEQLVESLSELFPSHDDDGYSIS